jgi:hypothetical protein
MRINKALNLVVPLSDEKGWIHATPVSYEIFEKYFLPISKAHATIYKEGLGAIAGPRVAYLMLKKVAEELGMWEGEDGVENGLMNEVFRLTNVIVTGAQGWVTLPLYEAIRQEKLDDEEMLEVKNTLVFFILASFMHKKTDRELSLRLMTSLYGGQITLLTCMEYVASLPISTTEESIGKKAHQLSIPS